MGRNDRTRRLARKERKLRERQARSTEPSAPEKLSYEEQWRQLHARFWWCSAPRNITEPHGVDPRLVWICPPKWASTTNTEANDAALQKLVVEMSKGQKPS
jgi:hypothetical protein